MPARCNAAAHPSVPMHTARRPSRLLLVAALLAAAAAFGCDGRSAKKSDRAESRPATTQPSTAASLAGRLAEAAEMVKARDYVGAAQLARLVLAAGGDAEAAKRILSDVSRSAGPDVVPAVAAEAQAGVRKIAGLDASQGFGAHQQKARALLTEAQGALGRQEYGNALLKYLAVSDECSRLLHLDRLRHDVAQLHAQVAARQQWGTQAKVPSAAPKRWQQAEQARTAADQAFQKGDFEEARKQLLIAQAEQERAVNLAEAVRTAQQLLAAGALTEAEAAAQAALAMDAENAPAQKVLSDARVAAARRAAAPARTRAEAAVQRMSQLAAGEGFGDVQKQVRANWEAADALLAKGRLDEAIAQYEAVTAASARLIERDEVRRELSLLRARVAAGQKRLSQAQVQTDAPGCWQRAEAAKAAAEQALAKGDFDTAGRQFTVALAEQDLGESIMAGLVKARTLLAAGRLPDARRTAAAVLTLDADNAPTKQVVGEVAAAVARQAAAPVKARADAAMKKINALDAKQGFGALRDKARAKYSAANQLFTQNQFDKAVAEYEAIVAESVRLAERDGVRRSLVALRTKIQADRQRAVQVQASQYAPKRWQSVETAWKTGEQAFQQGKFEDARKAWATVKAECDALIPHAEGMKRLQSWKQGWVKARAALGEPYRGHLDRLGGPKWKAVRALVKKAENESVSIDDRIAAYEKAAAQMPDVAKVVKAAYDQAKCNEAAAKARKLLEGVPAKATERTQAHVQQAKQAEAACLEALKHRPEDPAALALLKQARRRALLAEVGKVLLTLDGHTGWIWAVRVSGDGQRLLSCGADKTVKLWDLWQGQCLHTLTGHGGDVTDVAISSDGRRALSASEDWTAILWDLAGKRKLRALSGHEGHVNAVAFSPDGRAALSASDDRTLRVWDLARGKAVRTFTGHDDGVRCAAFSPDGKTAVSGSDDKTLKLWRVADGKCLRTLAGHGGYVSAVAFSPDGRTVLSGSSDKTLKLWTVSDGKCIRTFSGHGGGVEAVAFRRDGRAAVSGGWDKVVRVWEVATGRQVHALEGHANWIRAVAFSPDGLLAVSGSDDKTLRVWYLGKGSP